MYLSTYLVPVGYLVPAVPVTGTLHTLSGRIGKAVGSRAAVSRSSPAEVALIDTMSALGAQGVLLRVECATSQLDLPSLAPLSVAGCC